jgi:hypothetical protein
MQPQLFTSDTAEHNPPADIIERMRYVFDGPIALDPASNIEAQAVIRAERYYTIHDDGLARDWAARSLWLNPPFSVPKLGADGAPAVNAKTGKPIRERVIGQWVGRWRATVAASVVMHAGLLVPARVDTEWHQPLFGMPMCFVSGRLRFSDADNGAPFPTAIIYRGPNVDRFFLAFDPVGVCGRFTK